MFGMTKKQVTEDNEVELMEDAVSVARDRLRDVVEARRAVDAYRPMGRLSLEAWTQAFLARGDATRVDADRLNEQMGRTPGLFTAAAQVRHTAAQHIARREWGGPPAEESSVSYLGRPFDNTKAELARVGSNVLILLCRAAEDAARMDPSAFGELSGGEHEQERRALHERLSRARARLAEVPEEFKLAFAVKHGIFVDTRPDGGSLDARLEAFAVAAS